MTYNQILLVVYAVYLVIFSLIAFFTYGKDKKMAKNGTEVRIKEKTLLGLSIFGGGIGAFMGRLFFHHKTNKVYFSITIYLSLLTQIAVLVLMVLTAGGIL